MSVGQRKKFWVLDRNRTHDLPNTSRARYKNYELRLLVAQWIERQPGVREFMGSIPDFSLSHARVILIIFHISLSSLKFTVFIHLSLEILSHLFLGFRFKLNMWNLMYD